MAVTLFVLSAIDSLTASGLLVARLERIDARVEFSEALLGTFAALATDGPRSPRRSLR